MLDHYHYFYTNKHSYETLLNLESVDPDSGTAGHYPTLGQWQRIWNRVHVQQDRWVFSLDGKGYVMRGERTSPRGIEYVQLILLERGEMTVRQISQLIRSLDTEAVRNQLDTLIRRREVESKQVGKKTVYYNVV